MVVQKYLQIGDLAFVNAAFLSAVAEYIIKMLAMESWHMYLGETLFNNKELDESNMNRQQRSGLTHQSSRCTICIRIFFLCERVTNRPLHTFVQT